MYKSLGVSNTDIALYTSWLYLPWVIKPLWSPLVDLLGTQAALDRGAAVPGRRGAGDGGAGAAGAELPAAHAGAALADGLRLGHARHRRRRLLHAGAAAAHAGGLRRRAQHLLPAGDDRRPGRAGLCWPAGCRSAAGTPAAAWSAGVLAAGGAVRRSSALYHLVVAAAAGAATRPAPRHGAVLGRLRRRLRGLLPPAGHRAHPGLPAAVPLRRGAAAQAGHAVPARPARGRRPGPEHTGRRHRLRHRRRDGADARRPARRLGGLAPRPEAPAVAAGAVHPPARRGLRRAGRLAAAEPRCWSARRWRWSSSATASASPPTWSTCDGGRRRRRQRQAQDRALRAVHRLHGAGHDAAGHGRGWLQDQLGYPAFFVWACVATLPSFAAAALLRIDPEFGRRD